WRSGMKIARAHWPQWRSRCVRMVVDVRRDPCVTHQPGTSWEKPVLRNPESGFGWFSGREPHRGAPDRLQDAPAAGDQGTIAKLGPHLIPKINTPRCTTYIVD